MIHWAPPAMAHVTQQHVESTTATTAVDIHVVAVDTCDGAVDIRVDTDGKANETQPAKPFCSLCFYAGCTYCESYESGANNPGSRLKPIDTEFVDRKQEATRQGTSTRRTGKRQRLGGTGIKNFQRRR